ncbi:hypothetical protein CCP3SC15_710006 [Gammaproteobacteria bacterium]
MSQNDYIWVSRREWERVVRKLDGIRFDQSGFAHHTPTGLRLKAYGGQATPPVTSHPFKIWYKVTNTDGVFTHKYAVSNATPIDDTTWGKDIDGLNYSGYIARWVCAGTGNTYMTVPQKAWTAITGTKYIYLKITIDTSNNWTAIIEDSATRRNYNTTTSTNTTVNVLLGLIYAFKWVGSNQTAINPYIVEQHIFADISDNFLVWR